MESSHRIRRLVRHGIVAAAVVTALVTNAWGGFTATTGYEIFVRDQLDGNPTFEDDDDSKSANGTTTAFTSGSISTTYQNHQYATEMGGLFNVFGDHDVALYGTRSQTLQLSGVSGPIKWDTARLKYTGHSTFTDTVNIAPPTGSIQPDFADVSFVWELTGFHTQRLDTRTGEKPLYRIKDHAKFDAREVGGLLYEPATLDVTTYDPDANVNDPRSWSELGNDINVANQPVPGVHGKQLVLKVNLRELQSGGFQPLKLQFDLDIESEHNFLNDGSTFNYGLSGFIEYHFANSADLVGIIIRDETGAIRTDAVITSAEGISYTQIPEPAATAGLLALLAPAALRRRKAR